MVSFLVEYSYSSGRKRHAKYEKIREIILNANEGIHINFLNGIPYSVCTGLLGTVEITG